jgi:hypothetical protein
MKIILSILSVLLLACTTPKTEIPTEILSETEFANMLKEVHLAEAAFELNKSKGVKTAKKALDISYSEIYLLHDIKKEDFENTLSYYANHPEELEQIYSKALNELMQESATLNP